MTFSSRLQRYLEAEATGNLASARMLPMTENAKLRINRHDARDRAREWRLVVEGQIREVRKTIADGRSQAILATEVECLLNLLGDIPDDHDN